MNDTEVRKAVAECLRSIAPEVDISSCDGAAPMTRELDLDSMDLLSLLAAVAERTGVDIPDSEVDSEWSLDDLVAYVSSR